MKLISLLYTLSFLFLNASIPAVLAKAPETAKIAFASTRNENRDIYLMNPDGTQPVNLTQNFADDLHPAWSPIGEQILFVSDRGGMRDLYLMDPNGKNVRKVFRKAAHREHPTWAPDGKQIAYERGKSIYIATLGKQIEDHLVDGFHPAWSPDGTEIAFASGIFGSHRLTLINVRTGRQKALLPEDTITWQHWPVWSTTGEKVAFSWLNHVRPIGFIREVGDKETIYIVNRNGKGFEQIVDEVGPKATWPAWSPAGDELIYTQEIHNRRQLFKINLGTRNSKQLTHIERLFESNAMSDWFDPVYALPVSPQPHLLTTIWAKMKKK